MSRLKIFLNVSACNCHGHSDRCVYSKEVDLRGESMDIHGIYEGEKELQLSPYQF